MLPGRKVSFHRQCHGLQAPRSAAAPLVARHSRNKPTDESPLRVCLPEPMMRAFIKRQTGSTDLVAALFKGSPKRVLRGPTPAGEIDGHQWGETMATSGEFRGRQRGETDGHQWGISWPPTGRNRWPLTRTDRFASWGGSAALSGDAHRRDQAPQRRLYFLPEPHGHGSLRPGSVTRCGSSACTQAAPAGEKGHRRKLPPTWRTRTVRRGEEAPDQLLRWHAGLGRLRRGAGGHGRIAQPARLGQLRHRTTSGQGTVMTLRQSNQQRR